MRMSKSRETKKILSKIEITKVITLSKGMKRPLSNSDMCAVISSMTTFEIK